MQTKAKMLLQTVAWNTCRNGSICYVKRLRQHTTRNAAATGVVLRQRRSHCMEMTL